MLTECLLQLAEEGVTHEYGGLFPQLLQLLLGQISLQAEIGTGDGKIDVFRKTLDLISPVYHDSLFIISFIIF